MSIVADLAITSLETITAFDITTGEYLFTLDELQNATIANTQEVQEITGKGGRLLNQLKRNKTVTISGTNGMLSGGLLALQTGGDFENKATKVEWTDYLTVKSNAAETTYVAVGTSGAEIEGLYVKNTDGTIGTQLEQDASAAAGKFAYNPSNKALTFSGLADDTEIVVFYKRNIQANVLSNISDKYSKKATLYIDAMAEDKCSNVYRVQIYVPKADFSGEFSFEMGDNQTVHDFEAQSLAGACVAGNSALLWTYTIFGANAADVSGETGTTGSTGSTGSTGN